MDLVKTLVRHVARRFYDMRSILIMDAILVHVVLTDDELTHMLGVNKKDLRALCARLKEDHLLADHVQKEEGPTTRHISKTYYYVHYTETIDAIKWKVHGIVSKFKEQIGAEAQPRGYVCPVCKSRYSTIDVVDSFSPEKGGFTCDLCGSVLKEEDMSLESHANQEKQQRLMAQIQPIVDTLQQIDKVLIPENTFQSSWAQALPVPTANGSNVMPAFNANQRSSIQIAGSAGSVSATSSNGVTSLQVSITSENESAQLERQRKEENARQAEENALPTWHVESTVGKTLFDPATVKSEAGSTIKLEADAHEEKPEVADMEAQAIQDKADEATLADYYARLAAQQAEDDDEEEEEEEEEEDDDEEIAFEDVTPMDPEDDEED